MTSRLKQLSEAGQGVWLDFMDRAFLKDGGFARLIAEDGISGATSNPSIFEKAIGHGDAYDAGLDAFLKRADAGVNEAYESLAIADIQEAADLLRPTYDRLDARDGYVSIEVSPYIANDTEATVAEARRLWKAIDRPNLMVKVPGTDAGVPAVRQLVEDGLNINITLLFSNAAYRAVAEAYLAGLEARIAKGLPIDRVASVASFFVSRIDSKIDAKIEKIGTPEVKVLAGKVAIANAKLAYAWYQDMVAGERWRALAAKGAMPQRLLWASTGTKNPDYPDTLYVDALIGPETVNTVPPKTLDAFRDHGTVAQTLTADVEGAKAVLAKADTLGLDLDGVTRDLVTEGVRLFEDAADTLLGAVADKRAAFLGDRLDGMRETLPAALADAVKARLETARAEAWTRRLWQGDASLWTGKDEAKWLGWLAAAKGEQVDFGALDGLAADARNYDDAVLLGMGGSSLGPEVLGLTFGAAQGHPRLHVLDTSDPGQIGTVARAIDPARTLFVVSSKSGSTLEPEILRAYFFDLVEKTVGKDKAGKHFVAVTDPGSHLEKVAREHGYAHVFSGDPAIGGRYSVLSVFGMVPAAIIGMDVRAFFAATRAMVLACGPDAPPAANPATRLGAIIGEVVKAGRDKLTILPSAGLAPLGPWLEQLLAESTGKHGTGVVPVDGEPAGASGVYGADRLFVSLHLAGDEDAALEAKIAALEKAGEPVVRITAASREQLGQEFFRWEMATAIAGAVIGINPFDQPDVEDAKVATRELVDEYERSGTLDTGRPLFEDADFAFYATDGASLPASDPAAILKAHFARLHAGNYAGFLAYIERNDAHEAALTRLRAAVRDATKAATVVGFGPRFLHSTGQVYKGGPATGVFLTLTGDPAHDLAVPGRKASFGTVELSQALGDNKVLAERGRAVLRVHLKEDASRGLERLVAFAIGQLEEGER